MLARPCFHRIPVALFAWFTFAFFLPRISAAQTGTAPTGDPGGFGIDGDLDAGTPVGGTSDWLSFMSSNGTPTSSATIHVFDAFNNNSDPAFFSASVNTLNANPNTQWIWELTSGMVRQLGGKEDFNHGLAHFSHDANGHVWFTWAVDRRGNGGIAYMDVGLYQNLLFRNGNGTFSSGGPHAGHTVGDLVFSLELVDQDTRLPILTTWRWTEITPGVFDFASLTPAAGTKFACVNADPVNVPYTVFGSDHYAPETFAEASIDLTALVGSIQPTVVFHYVFFECRFGQSIGSQMRDFIDPFPIQVTLDAPRSSVAGATRIVTITPNPARDLVTVELDLAHDGAVGIDFFDLAGRRVGSLPRAVLPAGHHSLRWDPSSVARARGGILFARLAGEPAAGGKRFVLLR